MGHLRYEVTHECPDRAESAKFFEPLAQAQPKFRPALTSGLDRKAVLRNNGIQGISVRPSAVQIRKIALQTP